jgi:hypothetical protein
MATFAYSCPVDGPFDLRFPVGTAAAVADCPTCGSGASRVFTAPMISTGDRGRAALIERCERTASAPDVVTAPPPAGRRPQRPAPTRNPAWAKLPRP